MFGLSERLSERLIQKVKSPIVVCDCVCFSSRVQHASEPAVASQHVQLVHAVERSSSTPASSRSYR